MRFFSLGSVTWLSDTVPWLIQSEMLCAAVFDEAITARSLLHLSKQSAWVSFKLQLEQDVLVGKEMADGWAAGGRPTNIWTELLMW